jgi:hypothetical protein
MVISLNPFDVIEREAQWKPGEKSPHVGDFFFKQTDFLSRLNNGPVSLAHLIDMMDETQREMILNHTRICASR